MNQEEVVVISAVRSPFGKFGGAMKDFSLPKLGGLVVAEAIRRAGIAPDDVEEVATGVNLPGADRSIARQLLIQAGLFDAGIHARPADVGVHHEMGAKDVRRRAGEAIRVANTIPRIRTGR